MCRSCTKDKYLDLRHQLTLNVCDSIGAAESYRVSVSWLGSPWSWHWSLRVPAPQSQKNLFPREMGLVTNSTILYKRQCNSIVSITYRSCLMNSTSCPEWQVLMQLIQMALRSVVLHERHLFFKNKKAKMLRISFFFIE